MLHVSYNLSKEQWNNFINNNHRHTFLQDWEWGDFNESMGDRVFRIAVLDGETILGIAMCILVNARRGKFLFCPHGFIFKDHRFFDIIFSELKKLADENDCSFIRICTILEDSEKNRDIFIKSGFKSAPIHVHPEFQLVKDISQSEETMFAEMRKTTRYLVKKSEVQVRISENPEDLKIFFDLYDQTVKRQKFVAFSHKYIETEFRIFKGNIFLVMAENLSAVIIVCDGLEAYYHHGASSHHPTASYAVQWAAIKEAKKRGCKFYNFWGVWPEEAKNHPQYGLSQFKRGFGGTCYSYVHAQDFPLSGKYWINYLIESIRKKARGF